MIIETFVILAFLLDMLLTGLYLNEYKKRFPKNDWTLSEANPILRACVRKWDLVDGIVYGGIIIFFILLVIMVLSPWKVRYFLGGMYSMSVLYHWVNFQALKRLRSKEKSK